MHAFIFYNKKKNENRLIRLRASQEVVESYRSVDVFYVITFFQSSVYIRYDKMMKTHGHQWYRQDLKTGRRNNVFVIKSDYEITSHENEQFTTFKGRRDKGI